LFDYLKIWTDSDKTEGEAFERRFDGWSLEERNISVIQSLMPVWEWLYRYYFRVQTEGWHHIPPEGKMLIVGSHNGGSASPDTSMFMYDWFRRFGYDRPAYGLMHPLAWKLAWSVPNLARLAARVGAIMAHPKMAIAALQNDAAVLVYPGGAEDMFRPHTMRDRIYFAGRKGFIKLALREEVPIVPAISYGAHDTLIILGDFYKQALQLHEWGVPLFFEPAMGVFPIYLGLPWGLGIGPLPNIPFPVQIHTRVCAPIVFERYGREAACDRDYVDACYETVCTQMQGELDNLIERVHNVEQVSS
jgi:1-acyl-sn-glycerol-3-phosphate acyltransferase